MLLYWDTEGICNIIRIISFSRIDLGFRRIIILGVLIRHLGHFLRCLFIFLAALSLVKDFWNHQIKHIECLALKLNAVAKYFVPAILVPSHFPINQLRERFAYHLPAFPFIRLSDAPAQCVLIIFIAALHDDAFQFPVEHHVDIYNVLKALNAGRVEGNAVLPDCDGRISQMGKQLLSDNLISIIGEALLQFGRPLLPG